MACANTNHLQMECIDEAIKMIGNFSGKFVLKKEQEVVVKELLKGSDVLAILPTGFGKSLIYIVFLLADTINNTRRTNIACRSSILLVSSLRSIVSDQISEVTLMNSTAMDLSKETMSKIG